VLRADGPHPGYRPCVGLLLLDATGRVLVGRRRGAVQQVWQMPQGGIDPGEAPEAAGHRELREEIGTDNAVLLRASAVWRAYDLPPAALAATSWGARYRGQSQLWVAMRFTGTDADFDLESAHPELDAVRWVAPAATKMSTCWPG
jgi:putative (di)nucleoside polyphosphate hydrolase